MTGGARSLGTRLLHAGLAVVLGAAAALGLAPLGHWYVTLAALVALFALAGQAGGARATALTLWLFATAYFVVGLRWLLEPFQVEADIFGWMAPIALAMMAGGLALFWAAAGWAAAKLGQGPWRIWALVVTLGCAELARAWFFSGFPWAGLAQVWVGSPPAQALAYAGPHGLGLATLLAAAAPAGFAFRSAAAVLLPAALGALFFAAPLVRPELPETPGGAPEIRIVQPNAPQHEKWDPSRAATFFWRQIAATEADTPPALVVWPETAIPQLLEQARPTLDIVADAARGAPVIFGIQRGDAQGYYNALVLMDGDGAVAQTYDKHHLVPFGEYMPFPALFRSLGIRALAERADGGYTAGPGPRLIDVPGIGPILPLICYEAIFPRDTRTPGQRPRLLVQITNDAWFGTSSGPQQHLAQARMRAIELGLPMVRAANTGISAMIDAKGAVLAALPLGRHGHFDAPLPAVLPPTIYARTGDWPVAILLLFGICGFLARRLVMINN